jgi:hypothetical protein
MMSGAVDLTNYIRENNVKTPISFIKEGLYSSNK